RASMAYWSDILHGPAPAGAVRTRARRRADEEQDEGEIDVEAILKDAAVPAGTRKKAAERLEGIAAALARAEVAGPRSSAGRGAGAKALPLPGFLRKPIARAFLERFLKDVAAYFYQPGIRKRIQDRLRAEIKRHNEPFVLVSHSLGTIVAFEVLSDPQLRRPDCSLLVTMGSPLGIQEVQEALQDLDNQLIVPARVRAWHNFADRFDPVALDAGLGNDFKPRGATNGAVRVIDRRILNERTVSLRQFNPHSSLGYLSHPDVRTVVHRQIGFDSFGRFVVARDVAEEFVADARPVPVLIEVLEPGYNAVDESLVDLETRESGQPSDQQTLSGRIANLKGRLEEMVIEGSLKADASKEEKSALLQEIGATALRKYVSARLTPEEINALVAAHRDLNVYAVWRNSSKRKLLQRSHGPLKVDAGRASYGAVGQQITWAVLDTGVRWDHPHFLTHDSIIEVWDCTQHSDGPVKMYRSADETTSEPSAGDRDGHGTHVCGIIAGEYSDGSTRIQGIAPRARLIVYKVLDDDGFGDDAWIIKAIDHIFLQNESVTSGLKIHGVNLSLGGSFDASVYGCGFSPICKELRDLWRQGTLVCVAAGNEGQIQVQTDDGGFDLNTQLSIGDPANLQDGVAVGSVNADKPHLYGVSWFSSRGPTADGRPKPDVVAPGERILSCSASFPVRKGRSRKPLPFAQLFRTESGTSMACPHVSGLLAAFLSVRREFLGRPDEVKQILLDNCNDLGRDRYHQGAGMPNLMKMLMNT
ncbi:MAG: S8 family peptidase, partial [Pirellulaceae bacterium]|nr:S8 family peptidase [Pirellulaceae bacterium]